MTPLEILGAILNSLWQTAALAVLVWLALKFARVNAATRCVIWWAVLVVLVVLPAAPRFRMWVRQSESTATMSVRDAATPAVWHLSPVEVELPTAIVTLPEKRAAKWPLIVVAVWAVVLLFRLGRIIQSYLYLRGVTRKSATSDFPLPDVGRSASVLISRDIASPMAIGFLHPAIVLPEDLAGSMTRGELDQIVLHEAAHLARRDDWWNLIARLLGAVLALHPVAWWILRQIEYEREAACDDWVVARTGAARLYAETLAHIVELRWANGDSRRNEALASGVFGRGSRIGERIETLLEAGRQFSPRVSVMRVAAGVFFLLLLAGAGSLTPRWIAFAKPTTLQQIVAPVATLKPTPATAPVVRKQSQPRPLAFAQASASPPVPRASAPAQAEASLSMPQAFDAASIRPLPSPDGPAHFNVYPNRLDVKNMNLRFLIEDAYDLPDFELSGLDSVRSHHYDIAATTASPVSRADMRIMLRNLLAERFHLTTHWDERTEPVFRLEKLPGSLKLKPSDVGQVMPNSPFRDGETIRFTSPMSMHQLADSLTRYAGKPVIDATSLEGYFTIALTFASEDMDVNGNGGGTAPFLKDAIQEQLGLKLTPVQQKIKILVVDHADDTPTEN